MTAPDTEGSLDGLRQRMGPTGIWSPTAGPAGDERRVLAEALAGI